MQRVSSRIVLFGRIPLYVTVGAHLLASDLARDLLAEYLGILFRGVLLVADLDVDAHVSVQVLLRLIHVQLADLATSLLKVNLLGGCVTFERGQLLFLGRFNIRINSFVLQFLLGSFFGVGVRAHVRQQLVVEGLPLLAHHLALRPSWFLHLQIAAFVLPG